MALIHVFNGINKKTTYTFNGRLRDHIQGIDWENSIVLKGGYRVNGDYDVQADDIIYIRRTPTSATAAIVVGVIAICAAGVAVGVSIYQNKKALAEIEAAQTAAKAVAESSAKLPYIKGARNQAATGRSFPVAIGESLKFGGDDFTEALSRYVRRKYNVLLGDLSAEDAKIEVGSVLPRKNDITYEVKGRNLMNGLPARVELSANETVEAFSELANRIADKVLQIIDKADPELVSDVTEEGILLSGGGSLIYGMEKLLAERTGLKISPSNEPLNVIAAGAGMAGEYISYIEEEKRQNDLDD